MDNLVIQFAESMQCCYSYDDNGVEMVFGV